MYVPILKNRTIEMSVLSQLAEIGVFNSTSVLPLVELIQEKTRSNNKNTILDDLAELLNINSSMTLMIDFLKSTTKSLLDSGLKDKKFISAKGKNVIVIGGGDTGNDCVGTSIRHGAKSVTQLEMMPKLPDERAENNPWPEWPRICKTDYGQEEAIAVFGHDPRIYQTTVKEFKMNKKGEVTKAVLVSLESKKDEKTGRMMMVPVEGSEKEIPADLVLIAAGFLGSEAYVTEAFGVKVNQRTNVETKPDSFATNVENVFTAGDMHRGQSLVVWAIREGRDAAREVDKQLMGYTNL